MAAPLPLPALHATHAGIWIAAAARRARARRAAARRSLGPRKRRTSSSTRRWSGSGSAIPTCRARSARAVRVRPSGALRGADGCGLSRALGLEPPASEAEAAGTLIADCRAAACHAGRWALARARRRVDLERDAAPAGLGLGAPGRRAARTARARRAHAVLAPQQWEEAAERPPPRTIVVDPADGARSSTELTGPRPSRAKASGQWPRR